MFSPCQAFKIHGKCNNRLLLYACCNLPELWYLMVSTYSAEFRGGLDEGHANDKQITTDSITCESMHQHRGVGLSLPLSMHAEWCGLGEAMSARTSNTL